ncbi:GtrA family protein [Amedibacillus dolichus]|nr:GtrA family protein [Amedibacillus dolichus]CDE23496.1 gtrA-like protein [Amedibacillus dolichus CAG:375]
MRLKSLLVNMMMQIFHKYKEMILYIFFGICTTAVNIVVYYISFYFLSLGTSISTILSWLLSVIFAYLTNKLWVFNNNATSKGSIIKEIVSFYGCRLATGALDLCFMVIFVDCLHFNNMLMKILSNVIVVILNYIFSKFYIFKK